MIKEAIILAGGLGTRLKGVISDIPKPMAPIQDTPFIEYLFEYLIAQGISHAALAVGYKYEVIENYFGAQFKSLKLSYAIENTPLGTGGGIANALSKINSNTCFLLNGDTFFNVDLTLLAKTHTESKADLTLSLKEMQFFDRYGTVKFNDKYKITDFVEKQPLENGHINGGVYALNKSIFSTFTAGQKFSFEQDIMEAKVNSLNVMANISDGYFIDIGIPEDYSKAQTEIPELFTK